MSARRFGVSIAVVALGVALVAAADGPAAAARRVTTRC